MSKFIKKFFGKSIIGDDNKNVIKRGKNPNEIQKNDFETRLSIAHDIVRTYSRQKSNGYILKEHPIYRYIRFLGKSRQYQWLHYNLFASHEGVRSFDYEFMEHRIKCENDSAYELKYPNSLLIYTKNFVSVELSKDLVMVSPWNRSRLASNFSCIDDWREDKSNHFIYVWQPIKMCLVENGNHSITTGIIDGQGIIENGRLVDMKNLYDCIYTDGVYYYNSYDGSIICKVNYVEFAVIFEIGRLIIEQEIY